MKMIHEFKRLRAEIATALFGTFLLNDYRGSQKDLKRNMTDERISPAFIFKIRDFYYRLEIDFLGRTNKCFGLRFDCPVVLTSISPLLFLSKASAFIFFIYWKRFWPTRVTSMKPSTSPASRTSASTLWPTSWRRIWRRWRAQKLRRERPTVSLLRGNRCGRFCTLYRSSWLSQH